MNASELLSSTLAVRLGWTLLHSLWQVALAAAMLVALNVLLRRRSPQARYLAAGVCMAAVVAMAVATFVRIEPGVAQPPSAVGDVGWAERSPSLGQASPTNEGPANLTNEPNGGTRLQKAEPRPTLQYRPVSSAGPSTAVVAAAPSQYLLQRIRAALNASVGYLTAVWLAGMLAMGIWRLGGYVAAQRLRALGTQPAGEAVEALANRLIDRLGVRRPIRVLRSMLVQTPMVIGHLKPVILLPLSALTNLTPDQLQAVLAHELAHIGRGDYLVNLLQAAVEMLFFYHPGLWWISKRMRIERERCCDDLAVAACGNRIGYAEALATIEESRHTDPALGDPREAMVALRGPHGHDLTDRIRRVLGMGESQPFAAGRAAFAVLLVAAVVAFTVGISCVSQDGRAGRPAREESAFQPATQPAGVQGMQAQDPASTITGTVVDDSGNGVPGATVVLVAGNHSDIDDRKVVSQSTSSSDGSFILSWPQDAGLNDWRTLVASKDGFAHGWTPVGPPPSLWAKAEIKLSAKVGTLNGKVSDESGKPVVGATVKGLLGGPEDIQGSKACPWLLTKTDNNGEFRLTGFSLGSAVFVYISAPGYADLTPEDKLRFDSFHGWQTEVQMKPEAKIEGLIVDREAGKPAAGVWLQGKKAQEYGKEDWPYFSFRRSDEQGHFAFHGLRPGHYEIRPLNNFWLPDEWVLFPSLQTDAVAGKPVDLGTIAVVKGVDVECRVADADSGEPISGAWVSLKSAAAWSNRKVTDRQGVAHMRVLEGVYPSYGASAEQYQTLAMDEPLVIKAGQTQVVNLKLKKANLVQGKVLNPDGTPAAGMVVSASGFLSAPSTVTDSSGQFNLGARQKIPPTAILIVRDMKRNLAAWAPYDTAHPVEIHLSEGAVLRGSFVDETGTPVAGGRFFVICPAAPNGAMIADLFADQVGRFEVKAVPAGQSFTIVGPGNQFKRDDVTIPAGQGGAVDIPPMRVSTTYPATSRPATSSPATQPADKFVYEGIGWDGVRLESTMQQILGALGQPQEHSDYLDHPRHSRLGWRKSQGIDVLFKDGQPIEIRFNAGFAGQLTTGLGIGSSQKDVFKAYGQPATTKVILDGHDEYDDCVLYKRAMIHPPTEIIYQQKGVLFWFDPDGKVVQFVIFRPLNTGAAQPVTGPSSQPATQLSPTAQPASREAMVTRVYDIRDLIVEMPDQSLPPVWSAESPMKLRLSKPTTAAMARTNAKAEERANRIIKTIREDVDSDTWNASGADMRILNGNLVITQTPEVQEDISRFTEIQRTARGVQVNVEARFLRPGAPLDTELAAKLDEPTRRSVETKRGRAVALSEQEAQAIFAKASQDSGSQVAAPRVTGYNNQRAWAGVAQSQPVISLPDAEHAGRNVAMTFHQGVRFGVLPVVALDNNHAMLTLDASWTKLDSVGPPPVVSTGELSGTVLLADGEWLLARLPVTQSTITGVKETAGTAGAKEYQVGQTPAKPTSESVYVLIKPTIIVQREYEEAATLPSQGPACEEASTQPAPSTGSQPATQPAILSQSPGRVLYLWGSVQKPGIYWLPSHGMTLKEFVASAGIAPSHQANDLVAVLVRALPQNAQGMPANRKTVNLGDLNAGREKDIALEPNDLVMVLPEATSKPLATSEPDSSKSVLYITGEVDRPGVYDFTRGSTLSRMLVAGGLSPVSHGKEAVIWRRAADGRLTQMRLDVDELMAGTTPDPEIRANDVLVVRAVDDAQASGSSGDNSTSQPASQPADD